MIRALLWLSLILLPGIAAAQVGTPVASGATVTIDAHGECRKVTNPGSGTRMVFTGTAAEWQSFRNNPSGLTMAACPPACGGASVGGYCWYMGAIGQSCTTVCASHGGYNNATRTFAGDQGTGINCRSVLDALGQGSGAVGTDSSDQGCWEQQDVLGSWVRTRGVAATTATAASTLGARACACNS